MAGTSLATLAKADNDHGNDDADVLYGHGMVWNRDLPGPAGDLKLAFDLRVNLETGIGFGTASDAVHPEANIHFSITSADVVRVRQEHLYTLKGEVTRANNPENVGLPIRILAQTRGDTTAVAIAIGDKAFAGAGLVVIAINVDEETSDMVSFLKKNAASFTVVRDAKQCFKDDGKFTTAIVVILARHY